MPTPRKLHVKSVRGLWLGHRMRELREQLDLTQRDAAAYLDVDHGTLARYERCEWPFRPDLVTALLNAYGVYDERLRAELWDLARDSACLNALRLDPTPAQQSPSISVAAKQWPVGQAQIAPPPPLAWLYEQATEAAVYAPTAVPDLLRTRAYTLALAAHADTPATAAHHQAETLAQRQQHTVEAMVPVTAVIDATVLHRPIGGSAVLAAQLDHLLDLAGRDDGKVAIQILPTDRDLHPGTGAFTVLRLGFGFPPVAVVEHLGGHLLLEGPWAARYATTFHRLADVALTQPASHIAIVDRAKELANQTTTDAQ
jgi:transcriptional regulator with XRE-family HTH domain